MQCKSVNAGDVKIVYHTAGDGDSPAICLLPSTGRSGRDFHELCNYLTGHGFKVILPEPRGIGGSVGPMAGIDFHDLAADAVAAIRAETNKVIIAGHAFGCWLARTVAADYPDLVSGLVLIAAGSGKWPSELSEAINTLASAHASREERLAALSLAFFTPSSNSEPWLEGWHSDVIATQRAARASTDRESWWHSGRAPILDLVGLQDPFRPASSRNDFVREFKDRVSLVTIDGASHALPDEKPEEVAEEISKWSKTIL
ncbi:MAG: alpha/beta fold hydrolase [Granulosicoccus sp.]